MKPASSIAGIIRRGQWRAAGAALLCACVFMGTVSLYALHQFALHEMELVAHSLAFASEPAVRFRDIDALSDLVEQIARQEQLATVDVRDAQERLLLSFERKPSGWVDEVARRVDVFFMPIPVLANVDANGVTLGRIQLRSDGRLLMRYLMGICLALSLCVLVTAAAIVLSSRQLAQSILGPVNGLVELTREVRTTRDFERRAPPTEVIEINALADDFNSLLAELQEQQRKISARHADLRQANAALRHASLHDGLTLLPNRAHLLQHMEEDFEKCRKEGTRAGLLFVDVDKFKQVNDVYGHEAGDTLLKELASRLQASVRETDFVARHGGDEFIVMISPLLDVSEVQTCATRIHDALARTLRIKNGEEIVMGVTIGAAIFPDHGSSIDDLIHSADSAMYRAKSKARGSLAVHEGETAARRTRNGQGA